MWAENIWQETSSNTKILRTGKIQSLIQNSYIASCYFYDALYLLQHFTKLDYKAIVESFHKKSAFRANAFASIEQLINSENNKMLSAAWKNSLAHQISDELPDYTLVKNELSLLFDEHLNQ